MVIKKLTKTQTETVDSKYTEEVLNSVKELKKDNLWVSQESENVLKDAYSGTDIAIMEAPQKYYDSWNKTPENLANDLILHSSESYDLVITYVSETGEYAVSVKNEEIKPEVLSILENADATSNNFEETLFSSFKDLQTLTSQPTQAERNHRANVGTGLAVGGGLVLTVALSTTLIAKSLKKRNTVERALELERKSLPEFDQKLFDFKKSIELQNSQGDKEIAKVALKTHARISDLFTRLERAGDGQKLGLAQIEYSNILEFLAKALDKDYYLDIYLHPELWSNPENRKKEVYDSLVLTESLARKNIKQLNSANDLDFEIALVGINNAVDRSEVNPLLQGL